MQNKRKTRNKTYFLKVVQQKTKLREYIRQMCSECCKKYMLQKNKNEKNQKQTKGGKRYIHTYIKM